MSSLLSQTLVPRMEDTKPLGLSPFPINDDPYSPILQSGLGQELLSSFLKGLHFFFCDFKTRLTLTQ